MVQWSFMCLFLDCIPQEGVQKIWFFLFLLLWPRLLVLLSFRLHRICNVRIILLPIWIISFNRLPLSSAVDTLTIILIGETTFLAYMGIKISMRYVLYTGLAEITFLIITSIYLIISLWMSFSWGLSYRKNAVVNIMIKIIFLMMANFD